MSLLRVVPLLIVVFALSACTALRPGAAVVIDGEVIDMKAVDEGVQEYCDFVAAGGQPAEGANPRQVVALELTVAKAAADIMAARNLEVDEAIATVPDNVREQVRAKAGDKAEQLLAGLERSRRQGATLVAIGVDVTGRTPNEDIIEALYQDGYKTVVEELWQRDVTFAPKLGIAEDLQPTPDPSRLSVAVDPKQDLAVRQERVGATCSVR